VSKATPATRGVLWLVSPDVMVDTVDTSNRQVRGRVGTCARRRKDTSNRLVGVSIRHVAHERHEENGRVERVLLHERDV